MEVQGKDVFSKLEDKVSITQKGDNGRLGSYLYRSPFGQGDEWALKSNWREPLCPNSKMDCNSALFEWKFRSDVKQLFLIGTGSDIVLFSDWGWVQSLFAGRQRKIERFIGNFMGTVKE
ncbi:hypothetical protein CEXT_137091 [Caerostris extrusa]|uniref:Uncharacterized protein n=1 Tax=Caerostris extrusa TaxID=172846 RepID=A0AAV4NPE6_CAEEX|nr:hypothetical protein CEXT_137091 [Caerostris extrusa]